jgi:hypothetical protein
MEFTDMKTIIEMAQECGLIGMRPHLDGIYQEALAAFAALVAAAEREACAKMVEDKFDFVGDELIIADAIRERGQA